MNTEDEKDDMYWMGVRDALRMVDSFVRWSRRHPEHAKPLEDFISDGLLAAAKRCESCLSKSLGVSFRGDDRDQRMDELLEDEPDFESSFERTPTESSGTETSSEETGFIPPDFEGAPHAEVLDELPASEFDEDDDVIDDDEIDPLSTDSFEISVSESADESESDSVELDFGEERRDFESDFDLVEPSPYGVEPLRTESEVPPVPTSSPEEPIKSDDTAESPVDMSVSPPPDTVEEPSLDEPIEEDGGHLTEDTTPDDKSSDDDSESSVPRFTWTDYEKTMLESSRPVEDSKESEETDVGAETKEEPEHTTPPSGWSPFDEPSTVEETEPEHDNEDDIDESTETDEVTEDGEKKPVTRPPPPPPPESEESEEERRRKARRLFFGA